MFIVVPMHKMFVIGKAIVKSILMRDALDAVNKVGNFMMYQVNSKIYI